MNCVALLSLLLGSLLVPLVFAAKFIINLQESHLGMYEAVTHRIKVILESNILGCPLPDSKIVCEVSWKLEDMLVLLSYGLEPDMNHQSKEIIFLMMAVAGYYVVVLVVAAQLLIELFYPTKVENFNKDGQGGYTGGGAEERSGEEQEQGDEPEETKLL